MFNASRKIHQNATPADVTGEIPTAALLCGVDRKDGGSSGHESQERLNYRDRSFGWAGCIDAPELIPVGGCRAVFIDPAIGGMRFEGIAAITRDRA